MQKSLRNEIKRLSARALARGAAAEKTDKEFRYRFEKRTGTQAGEPPQFQGQLVHRHFDPVYCKRNANFLAKTLWKKALDGVYQPRPALNFEIDKPRGGKRSIMAFSIPDAAFANVLMRRIRERNIKRFSPHSFAYHPDKNIFDAIIDLRSFIVTTPKIYSVQIDFKNYFDCIPSAYLLRLMDNADLLSLTEVEKKVLKQFLFHEFAQKNEYALGNFKRRHKGTPQGSSISLILANLAGHSLDTALEKLPGKFVRFADDVTALCDSYEDSIKIERAFFAHCEKTGIEMNREKSPGIAVLADREAEIRTVSKIDYLGYSFTQDGLRLSERTMRRIKSKLSKLISVYLLHYVQTVSYNEYRGDRKEAFDWDLLGLISEIRNYLYGGLRESEINGMLRRGKKLKKVRGLMSFYALLDDQRALKELDGWLANAIERAMRKRRQILQTKYGADTVTPNAASIIRGDWLNLEKWRGEAKPETRLPSFTRGWRAARKYYLTFGLKDVQPPKYGNQYLAA